MNETIIEPCSIVSHAKRHSVPYYQLVSCGAVIDNYISLDYAKAQINSTTPLREIWEVRPSGQKLQVVPPRFSMDFSVGTIFARTPIKRRITA